MPKSKPLETEIRAYESSFEELMKHYEGKFVIFKGQEFIGSYDTFDTAAKEAIARFGKGPYLIRQVKKQHPIRMPTSVAFRLANASD